LFYITVGFTVTGFNLGLYSLMMALLRGNMLEVKVKFALEQAMKAKRGKRYSLSLSSLGIRWVWAFNYKPRPLYPRERDPVSIE
jgi:hypothetical protein